MKCNDALPLIHEYLDGGLPSEQAMILQLHLQDCVACRSRLRMYEKTEALVRALERPKVPAHVTASVISALPKGSRKRGWAKWLRRHPAVAAAAAFLIIMLSSILPLWNNGSQLVVRGDDLEGNIVIEGQRVIVPSGSSIAGDLVVENGTVQVEGDVLGNLTVIDGKIAMASTAQISGNIKQVDQALDWIWYKVNEWFQALTTAVQPNT